MKVDFKLETEDAKTANLLIVVIGVVVLALGVLVYCHLHQNQDIAPLIKAVPELIDKAKDMV
jgi:hypothetical protein